MLHRLRSRLTYANVVASLALFFALAGGSAVALTGSNTVFNDDIVNDEVTTADVRDDNLAFGGLYAPDLGPGSVGTSEVANNSLGNGDFLTGSVDNRVVTDNSLTGTDINESSLNLPPTTTTTFAGQGSVNLDNNDDFTGVVTKNLAAGSYAIAATANIATNDVRVEDSYNAQCELRNNSAFIGGARDRRFRPGGAASAISLSMNGGAQIPAGGGTVGVYCRYVDGTTLSNTLADAQMMITKIDGFF